MSSGIKKYIVGLIIKTSSDAETAEKQKVYLGKLNVTLVQVCFTTKNSYVRTADKFKFKFITF
jgi:hypothetical protein